MRIFAGCKASARLSPQNSLEMNRSGAVCHAGPSVGIALLRCFRHSGRMRILFPVLLSLMLWPVPGAAQSHLNAETFDQYTRGKTLFYGSNGQAYGVERYLPGRRVIWSFLDGECLEGQWYEDEGQICFVYEDDSAPQCWEFALGPNGLSALFKGDSVATELYEAEDYGAEMVCRGPDVGV